MKNYFAFVVLFLALSILACQDTREDLTALSHEAAAYKGVGMRIPAETGLRWMEFYRSSKQGKLNLLGPDYEVSAQNVNALLQSVSTLVGVAFHYGLDGTGKKHILLIPVTETLSLWNPIAGRIILDANTNTVVSLATASAWADNYKQLHPNDIWFHFFGANIFDEITAIPFFDTLNIEPALNDLNLLPQLLLVIWNDSLLFGRTRSDDDEVAIFDASNPCPPCAVQ